MPDKRTADRQRKRLMVRFGKDAPDRMAFARDLSERGMQIQTNNVVQPGTMLQLELKFPERTFTFWARVAWAKRVPAQLAHKLQCGMGVEFVEPDPEWAAYFRESVGGGTRRA